MKYLQQGGGGAVCLGGGGYILRVHRVSVAQEARVAEAATNDYTYLPLPRVQEAAVGRERKRGSRQRERLREREGGYDGDGECVYLSEL